MLHLGHKSLSLAEAKQHLCHPGKISSEAKLKPRGGEAYFFQASMPRYKLEFNRDQYQFIHGGTVHNDKLGVFKRYYYIKNPDGNGKNTLKGFQRHVYSFLKDESDAGKAPLYLIHYIGNHELNVDEPRGRCKKKTSKVEFPSTTNFEEMTKQVHEDILVSKSRMKDETVIFTDRAEHRQQAILAEPEIVVCDDHDSNRKQVKMTRNEIFSMVEFATKTEDFVRRIEVYPNLVMCLSYESLLQETIEILSLSDKDPRLRQLLSYDTTFSLGDFYVSVLVARNIKLVGDPIYPVAFLIHENMSKEHHEQFLSDILNALRLQESDSIPIVTNRDMDITEYLANQFPLLPNLFSNNDILRDVDCWARAHGGTSVDRMVLEDDMAFLISSSSVEMFDKNYTVVSSSWAKEFHEYFEANLKEDLINHVSSFVLSRFSALEEGHATNDISETMNQILKFTNDRKHLPLDTVVMALRVMQMIYQYEFSQALAGTGNYSLKKEMVHLWNEHLNAELIKPAVTKLEDIGKEILEAKASPKSTAENPNSILTAKEKARYAVENNMIGFAAATGSFTVASADFQTVHCVQCFPKPRCSCAAEKCFHILAVEMALHGSPSECSSYSLPHSRKRKR